MNYAVLLFVFFSLMIGLQSQAQHELEGHWWYCNDGTYYEVLLSDSVYQAMNASSFPAFPMDYEELSQNEIRVADFFNVALIAPNKAVLIDSIQTDTLHRLTDKVNTFTDYQCEMNLSRKDFNNLLYHEFVARAILRNCSSPLRLQEKIEEPPLELLELDLPFEPGSETLLNVIHSFEYETQPLPPEERAEYTQTNLVYNADSSRVLVEFYKPGLCNDHFTVHPLLFDSGKLIIRLSTATSGCPEKCLISFYLMIENETTLFVDEVVFRE